MRWWKGLKGRLRFNEPLSKHTSFKIGGKVSVLFEPKDNQDLLLCLQGLKKYKKPYLVIGKGTNILIKDKGFKGVVIRLSAPFFKTLSRRGRIISAGSGVSIQDLVRYLSGTRLGGYGFLSGIPGSVAGALAMNAGTSWKSRRRSMADITHKVEVLDKGCRLLSLSKKDCGFSYRSSKLGKYIILKAVFKLDKNKAETKEDIHIFLSYRRSSQDYSKPNAGCIFRNPYQGLSAGKLIQDCGLKGKRYGGAMISNKHANFILNFNRATSDDVLKLINIAKKEVFAKFGIRLKEEIRVVP